MPDHLTPAEAKRIAEIDAAFAKLAPLQAEKTAILNRARNRRHYAAKKSGTQS